MAKDFSFDVVSDFDAGEMLNAVDQAMREIANRYDFKGTSAQIEFSDGRNGLQLTGDSRNQLNALIDVMQSKLIRREISPKVLDVSGQPQESGTVMRWQIGFKKGLDADNAKKLTKLIREHHPKAKTQIQGDAVRVSSTNKDELQAIITLLKSQDLPFPLQFINYR
jgi:uncharacterized protein YajQ (UPF0234 family)